MQRLFIALTVSGLVGCGKPAAPTRHISLGDSTGLGSAAGPDCSGAEHWAATMAFVNLKNAGLTDNDRIDLVKTTAVRLASQKVDRDLYRQVHRVTFVEKSGKRLEVITVNDATSDECSGSGVRVYVVSRELGDTTR
jgi:hypothetical protein